MPKVRLTQKDSAGNASGGESVRIRLIASTAGEAEGFLPTGPYSIAGEPIPQVYLGADGTKDVSLVPNSLISPAGTTYRLLKSQPGRPAPVSYNISVPVGTFTVDAATNVITSVAHRLAVGDPVRVENAGGTLPGGLAASTDYWVKTVPTADTLTLSATSGGATLDITSAGSGTHSLIFFDHTLATPTPAALLGPGSPPSYPAFLVTTADLVLPNAVPVGTTPNGELGGTWDAITVDPSHSGSTHAAVQAAAEATAGAALAVAGVGQLRAFVYLDSGGTYRGYYRGTDGLMALHATSSATDCAVVFNALFAQIGSGLVGYSQNLTALTPIIPLSGTGIVGLSNDWKSNTVFPAITAGATFAPAGDGTGNVSSEVIRTSNDDVVLRNVSVSGSSFADSAVHGTGARFRHYNCSFQGGKYYAINTNGADMEGYGSDAKNSQGVGGKGAWRHGTASDAIWIGGRLSAGTGPTMLIAGGDGHVVSGLHITAPNSAGIGGNSTIGCDNSSFTNIYFDNQSDVNNASSIKVTGTGNVIAGCRVKGGNGAGTGCRVITVVGSGLDLIVDGLEVTAATGPQFAYLLEVNDSGGTPGTIVIDSVSSAASPQNVFSNSGRDAILMTAGAWPYLSNVVINGAMLDTRILGFLTSNQVVATASTITALSMTAPKSFLRAGTVIEYEAAGQVVSTDGGNQTVSIVARIGGTSVVTCTFTVAAGATRSFHFRGKIEIITAGAGGTMIGGASVVQSGGGNSAISAPLATSAVDTTVANALDIRVVNPTTTLTTTVSMATIARASAV